MVKERKDTFGLRKKFARAHKILMVVWVNRYIREVSGCRVCPLHAHHNATSPLPRQPEREAPTTNYCDATYTFCSTRDCREP